MKDGRRAASKAFSLLDLCFGVKDEQIMFLYDIELANYSNYRIGGKAREFFEAKNVNELEAALSAARKNNTKTFILGAGTNILFDDEGFDGLVLKPALSYINRVSGTELNVGAGVLISELLDYTVGEGLSGLEWAGGLPGTLGGAIRGNAGCFGGEIKDVVASVTALQIPIINLQFTNKSQSINFKKAGKINFANKECKFDYRSSLFKQTSDYIILEATLSLKNGDKKKIHEAIQEKIDYRKSRHPMEYPSIGSIFKNIPVASLKQSSIKALKPVIKNDPFPIIPAAYLISEAGLKGVSYGGAMISPKHPNFIVNVQSASSRDVKNLIQLVKSSVQEKFGIEIEEELIILPRAIED